MIHVVLGIVQSFLVILHSMVKKGMLCGISSTEPTGLKSVSNLSISQQWFLEKYGMFNLGSLLPGTAEFHHIGYATTSIEREATFFRTLGYSLEAESFIDTAQGVQGCFMSGLGPRVELLESYLGSKTLAPWVDAGIKMYHFAYMIDDMNACIQWARNQRAIVTVEPIPSVAFDRRLISFVMFRNSLLVEFIEKKLN